MASDPIFTNVPVLAVQQVSVANANRDGTGTIATVLTGSSSGTKVTRIRIEAVGTTTAGMVRLYINDGAGNTRLFDEQAIAAITPSATVAAAQYDKTYTDLVIPSGYSIRASTEKAETFNIIAYGGNF